MTYIPKPYRSDFRGRAAWFTNQYPHIVAMIVLTVAGVAVWTATMTGGLLDLMGI